MSRRQLTKHITYYELLDAVRGAAGCPLCDLEANAMRRYFESLLYENVNNPEVRAALARCEGYCHRHAHYLRSLGGGSGIAILYQDQLRLFLRHLDCIATGMLSAKRRATHARQRRLEECPACRTQNECRKRYCSTLVEWLHDQEMRSAFEAAHGLCVPHFLVLLDMAMDTKAEAFLIEMQRVRMNSLLQELEEFCRKHDYRFSGEGFGSESDSWSRAIRMMVGEDDAF